MKTAIPIAGILLCASAAALSQVTVTSPANNSTVTSPTQLVASAKSNSGGSITAMAVYVDNVLALKVGQSTVNAPLQISSGNHYVVVQAWDSTGQIYKTSLSVNANGGNGIPGNAQLFDNIDQMSVWQNCDVCAGPGGNGPPVPHNLTQYQSSPSLDGQSAQFWLGGTQPYSAALWWNQLGARPNATHFVYDLYFYMTTPGAAQALEFDANQSVGGRKYIFGTECNLQGSHQWDVWNGAHWAPTGVPCNQPSAYTWHHLVWEYQRSGSQAVFVAVTLDGVKSYVNRSYNSIAVNAQELNVAFQMDGNYREQNYSAWLDKIKFYYW